MIGELIALERENEKLRAEIKRLHEKYDLQLLVVQRDRYREGLEKIAKNPEAISCGKEWRHQRIAREALNTQAANKCGLCTDEKPCNFATCPNDVANSAVGSQEKK